MAKNDSAAASFHRSLENAKDYSQVWEIVKNSVYRAIHKRRNSMMLFLDDLPIQLGAYHPVGTNNIVLNRTFVQIVENAVRSRRIVNALIYNLLLHEYLHALGEYSELEVRKMVHEIAGKSFGDESIVAEIAKKSPWFLLKGIPLKEVDPQKRVIEIVKNFERADRYIV